MGFMHYEEIQQETIKRKIVLVNEMMNQYLYYYYYIKNKYTKTGT